MSSNALSTTSIPLAIGEKRPVRSSTAPQGEARALLARIFPGPIQRLLVWLLIFAAWEGAWRIFQWRTSLFPAPSQVIALLGHLLQTRGGAWYNRPLLGAMLVSLIRLAVGFCVSVALGAILGLAMWRSDWLDRFLGPLFLGLQTLPSVCWVPLAMLTFGLNEGGVLFVLVLGSFFAVAIALRDGLRTIPPLYQRVGLMLGARGWRLYRHVLLPASLPAFVGSLRQGFTFAWRSLMGAELIFAVENRGLGALLREGKQTQSLPTIVGIMIVMVIVGMLADKLVFARLQRAVNARFGL